MNIADIKIDDIIQVFAYDRNVLDLYEVINIYISENNGRVFECIGKKFDEDRKLININFKTFIEETDVMSIYNEVSR